MLPKPGEWTVSTIEKSVYENDNGTLVLALKFETQSEERITGYFCLTSKDGALNEKMIAKLKDIYGWDGADPFWFVDTDLTGVPVSITVEEEPGRDGQMRTNVKWINKPGQETGKPLQQGDRNSILSKYGSKFRAISGGQTVKKTPPPPPMARKAPPMPSLNVPPSTMQEAWAAFCEIVPTNKPQDEVNRLWKLCLQDLTGKGQAACQSDDWGLVKAGAKNWIESQLPF